MLAGRQAETCMMDGIKYGRRVVITKFFTEISPYLPVPCYATPCSARSARVRRKDGKVNMSSSQTTKCLFFLLPFAALSPMLFQPKAPIRPFNSTVEERENGCQMQIHRTPSSKKRREKNSSSPRPFLPQTLRDHRHTASSVACAPFFEENEHARSAASDSAASPYVHA
jgi:hypothetical protein